MAAGQDGNQRALDDLVLPEDNGGRRLVNALYPLTGRFYARDDVTVAIDQGCHDVNISPLFAFAKSCRGEDGQIMKDNGDLPVTAACAARVRAFRLPGKRA
jgi:hypothetical protein